MTVPVNEYGGGEPFVRKDDLNAIKRELSRMRELSGDGVDVSMEPGGPVVSRPQAAEECWARLTGESSGRYSWVEVYRSGAGTWSTLTGGRSGTTTTGGAREENDATGVASGTVVRLRASRADLSGTTVDKEWVFNRLTVAATSAAYGSLPAVTGPTVTRFNFVSSTGVYLSSYGVPAGTAHVALAAATRTQQGAVSTTLQSFAGLKEFSDGIYVASSQATGIGLLSTGAVLSADGNSLYQHIVLGSLPAGGYSVYVGTVDEDGQAVALGSLKVLNAAASGNTTTGYSLAGGSGGLRFTSYAIAPLVVPSYGPAIVSTGGPVLVMGFYNYGSDGNGLSQAAAQFILSDAGIVIKGQGSSYPTIEVTDGSSRLSGKDGTAADGSVFTKGILTTAGSLFGSKPTVTGSRGGNAALASLLTGLAALGLITDSTTA